VENDKSGSFFLKSNEDPIASDAANVADVRKNSRLDELDVLFFIYD